MRALKSVDRQYLSITELRGSAVKQQASNSSASDQHWFRYFPSREHQQSDQANQGSVHVENRAFRQYHHCTRNRASGGRGHAANASVNLWVLRPPLVGGGQHHDDHVDGYENSQSRR